MGVTPTPSAADIFAFDPDARGAGGAWTITDVVPIASISPEAALGLVAQVRWPTDCPLGPAIEAALTSTATSHGNLPSQAAAVSGVWHAIPYQGIDGRIDDFHLLIGTTEFIEDAGITLGPEAMEALTRHEERGWSSVLVGACHADADARSPRRSLLAVLAVAPESATAARPSPTPRQKPTVRRSVTKHGFQSRRMLITGLALVLLSASLGVWLAALRVATNQVAMVQRFGRVVVMLEPGLHIRPLWPFERVTRFDPHEVRTLTLGLSRDRDEAVPSIRDLMLTGDTWKGIPTDEAGTSSAIPQPQLLAATVRVQYQISDPMQYLFAARHPDDFARAAAESILRGLLSGRSMQQAIGPQRGTLATLLQQSLQQRAEAYDCGLVIHNVIIDDLTPADLLGDAARTEAEADERERIRHDTLLIQARNQADRIAQDAQSQATDILADAQIDQERIAKLAMNVLEWVRIYEPAFRRDPQNTRQQIIMALRSTGGDSQPTDTRPAEEVNP